MFPRALLRTTALRAVAAPRALPAVRSLHASTTLRASEQPTNPLEDDPRFAELRNKLQHHEGARNAVIKLGEVMQSKGVDLSKPPSPVVMLKLGMDAEIREAGQNLMQQLQDAGIELSPQTVSQMFSKGSTGDDKPK